MGWKASVIVVNPAGEVQHEELLALLGFAGVKKSEDKTFDEVIYPRGSGVYIGTYQNNLIICTEDLPTTFIENNLCTAEERLAQKFPDAEIFAFVLHSIVNYWGYSISKDGKKMRARAGSGEDGTYIEFGEPLEEELELLSKSTVDAEGKRTYLFERFPDEPLTEDQVGENFVFQLCIRYFGEQLDGMQPELFEMMMSGYSYSRLMPDAAKKPLPNKLRKQGEEKPWWRFW